MSTGPGFRLWPVEASLIQVERSWSLVQAQHVSAILNEIESKKCFANKQQYFITSLIILPTAHL